MASTISQIKQQVNQIGQQATSTAGQLSQLASNLNKNVAAISNAIGGTSSGEDKTMVASFQQASKQSCKRCCQGASGSGQSG